MPSWDQFFFGVGRGLVLPLVLCYPACACPLVRMILMLPLPIDFFLEPVRLLVALIVSGQWSR